MIRTVCSTQSSHKTAQLPWTPFTTVMCGGETRSRWVKAGCCCKPQISNPFDRFSVLVRIKNGVNTAWKMKVCLPQILQGLQVLIKFCLCEIEDFLKIYCIRTETWLKTFYINYLSCTTEICVTETIFCCSIGCRFTFQFSAL